MISSGFNNTVNEPAIKQYNPKINIGYGYGTIAIYGAIIVTNLAITLHIPNDVAFNNVGNNSFMIT